MATQRFSLLSLTPAGPPGPGPVSTVSWPKAPAAAPSGAHKVAEPLTTPECHQEVTGAAVPPPHQGSGECKFPGLWSPLKTNTAGCPLKRILLSAAHGKRSQHGAQPGNGAFEGAGGGSRQCRGGSRTTMGPSLNLAAAELGLRLPQGQGASRTSSSFLRKARLTGPQEGCPEW